MTVLGLSPELEAKFAGIGLNKQAKLSSEIRGSGGKPINIRLQESEKFTRTPFKPREYQVDLFKQALEKNVIIYLGTGLGKTFIVVMLIRSPQIDEQIRNGRRVVFLAPTQDLVKQQAEYVYRQVPYKVKVYCGRTCNTGGHIDNWNKADWDVELAKYELLFMTPAIFNQALGVNVLSWDSIALVIFDEAHHAATSKKEKAGKNFGSQYSQILKHYKEMYSKSAKQKPKFLGLTASLINEMPKDSYSIIRDVRDLESKLFAHCITNLSAIESKPKHVIWTYSKPELNANNDTLLRLFYDYAKRYEDALEIARSKRTHIMGPQDDEDKRVLAYHNRLRLASSGFSIKPQSFHKVLRQLAAIRAGSGLWTLANICHNLVIAMATHSKATCISESIKPIYVEFGNILKRILEAINDLIGSDYASILQEFTQPKLLCLLDILRKEHGRVKDKIGDKETFSCIVFVKSRVEVVAICSWLMMVSQHIAGYDFIKANYAIGLSATMASKWACITKRKSTEQSLMLEDFRNGKLNVIVTTSVLEEGIDLPVCSTVIRYDRPETFRVYVQSRGRARQRESSFYVLYEDSKRHEAKDRLDKFNDFEERVKEALGDESGQAIKDHLPSESHGGDCAVSGDADFFKDEENGIFITPALATTILHMYCSRLSRRPYSDGLQFSRQQVGDHFRTTLYFPPGCPVRDSVSGALRGTTQQADSSALIEAFKALYTAGELDGHGVPLRVTEEHIDQILSKCNMKPDFSKLDESSEGEIVHEGERYYHIYPWKLGSLVSSNISRRVTGSCYKLFRIVLVPVSGAVRQDTIHHFVKSAFGMIVDATQSHTNLPAKISSHYGEFDVKYETIDENSRIDSYRDHRSYFNYTLRLIRTFWNLRNFSENSFAEKCMFYFVPLDQSNNVDWNRLTKAFFAANDGVEPGDVVKINMYHSTKENSSKRFLVNQIRNDLNAYSMIPGCNETFKSRLERSGGHLRDPKQPVVSVLPISREHGRTSQARLVKSDHVTQPNYYLYQCLERIKCDPHEAYQAYNLPEIVYQLYLNALASDLERRFLECTRTARDDVIVPVNQDAIADVEEREDRSDDSDDDDEQKSERHEIDELEIQDGFPLIDPDVSSSEYDSDTLSQDESDEDSEFSSDSDEPAPAQRYRDILARQEFQLKQRDKSGLEKWDLSEYNVPDLKQQSVEYENTHHHPRVVDTYPRASLSCRYP